MYIFPSDLLLQEGALPSVVVFFIVCSRLLSLIVNTDSLVFSWVRQVKAFGAEACAALCITSEVRVEDGAASTSVTAEKSTNGKCERCWNYWASVGANAEYPDLCERCADVVGRL